MLTAIHHRHGPPAVLELVEVDAPAPGPLDVVVEVRACGVNRLDVLQRQGPGVIRGFSLPHVPGMDVAGEVAAVGAEVDGVAVGDRVVLKPSVHCGTCPACLAGDDHRCTASRLIGGNAPGGYAERCLVRASQVFPLPDGIGFVEAATVPTALSTAWRGIVATGRLQPGETVLIHGAGSGVSVLATQIAKQLGARVIVTSRDDGRLAKAAALGADAGVNTATDDLPSAVRELTGGAGADMVFDHVGPALFQQSLLSLRPGGRLVFCGTTTGAQASFLLPQAYHNGLSLLGVPNQRYEEFSDMIAHWWSTGFDPVVDHTLPLTDAVAAHEQIEAGDVFGKVVLVP